MENPFRYGGIVTGDYFADRTAETRELKREMENVNRIFLISPRRYGKTCLLHNLGIHLEKALRSEIQKHTHVAYIFSGSEQSMMLNMVQDKTRPFYKLGRIMELGPIKRKPYKDFILGWLKKGGYSIQPEGLDRIFDLGKDIPYNIQRLSNTMWETAGKSRVIAPEIIERLPLIIARQDSPHYEMIWQSATKSQKNLLIALSDDPKGLLFSREFQLSHGIGPSSSIKASLDSLLKKGILAKALEGGYVFVNGFMPFWIKDIRKSKGTFTS